MKNAIKLLTAGALAGVMLAGVSATAGAVDYSEIQPDYAVRVLEKMQSETYHAEDGTSLNYRIYKSPAYNAENKTAPALLFVFLHGSGGKGSDNEQQIKDQSTLVNYLVSDSADTVLKDLPYVVVAPQCPENEQWVDTPYTDGSYQVESTPISKNLYNVYGLIQKLFETENIDKENAMVSGISMGGYGAWDIALRFPGLFRSIVPICGGGDPTLASRLEGSRIWAFHCEGDTLVPVSASREMIDALNKQGIEASYTEFEINGHNAWKPAMEFTDPFLIEWLLDGVSYNVNIESEGKGTVTESKTLKRGESLTVKIQAAEGFELSELYIDDVKQEEIVESYTFNNVVAHHSLKAVYTEKESSNPALTAAVITAAVAALAAAGAAVTVISVKKRKKTE